MRSVGVKTEEETLIRDMLRYTAIFEVVSLFVFYAAARRSPLQSFLGSLT
jgi:hypothetical protein